MDPGKANKAIGMLDSALKVVSKSAPTWRLSESLRDGREGRIGRG